MDIKQSFKTHWPQWALGIIIELILLLLVYNLGVRVGYSKASFSFNWGANYHRVFGGPRGGWLQPPPPGPGFMDAHGTVGKVVKIDGSTIVMQGQDNVEKTVVTSTSTLIRMNEKTLKASDLLPDERIVVLGSPNSQGQIEAKFIRAFNP